MLKIFWHKCLGGWQKAEITPMENLAIHPAAKVLHYAVEVIVFERRKIQVFLSVLFIIMRHETRRINKFSEQKNIQPRNSYI